MSLEVGTSWGRDYAVEITAQPWYEYELKSACKVFKRDYEYTHDGWFSNPTYYASSHDKYGTEQWFFSHPYGMRTDYDFNIKEVIICLGE